MNQLRGVDATLYIRFLRGCCTSYFLRLRSTIDSHFLSLFHAVAHAYYVSDPLPHSRRVLRKFHRQEVYDTSIHLVSSHN